MQIGWKNPVAFVATYIPHQAGLPFSLFLCYTKFPKRFGYLMRTTIRDVAKRLNLSITTVSRALDGYADVAEETRQLIIRTAAEMGYSPNRAARQLRRQRTDTIGYILPAASTGLADPFFSEFIAGLADEAAAGNLDLLISTAEQTSEDEVKQYQRWAQSGKVDGLVLNRILMDDWRVGFLRSQSIPFVCLECNGGNGDFHGIEVDPLPAILELIEHLVNQGHSRIAYIGSKAPLKIDHDRKQAYLEGLRRSEISPDPVLMVQTDLTPGGGFQAADRVLDVSSPPTAIFCVNDLTAIGAMHAVHQRGLKVGRDIAVAGFDGIADSAHTQPGLTTIDQPVYQIGRQLISILSGVINGQTGPELAVTIQPRLILRGSTTV